MNEYYSHRSTPIFAISLFIIAFICFNAMPAMVAQAQIFGHGKETDHPAVDSSPPQTLYYRNIGHFRGGRSIAVSGDVNNPKVYDAVYTGGDVYKTTHAGKS